MTTDAAEAVRSAGEGAPDRRPEYRRRCAEAVAAAIREDAERIKRRELEEAVGRLEARGDLGDVERDAVEEMADAIVEGFLGTPADRLRRPADWPAIYTALRLFDPEFETADGGARGDGSAPTEGSDDD